MRALPPPERMPKFSSAGVWFAAVTAVVEVTVIVVVAVPPAVSVTEVAAHVGG